VKIPVYRQQVNPSGGGFSPNARAGRSGLLDVAEGMNAIVGAFDKRSRVDHELAMDAAQEQKRRQEDDDRLWAVNAGSQADIAMMTHLQKRQETAPPGASGLTPSFLEDFDKYSEGALQNAPNPRAKQLIQVRLAQSREQFARAALTFESQESVRYRGQQFSESLDRTAVVVAANPALFDAKMGEFASLSKTVGGAEAQSKYLEAARVTLTNAAMKGWIDQNPQNAAAILADIQKTGAENPSITWTAPNGQKNTLPLGLGNLEQRAKWTSYAEQKAKEGQATAEAGVFIEAANKAVMSQPFLANNMIDIPAAKAAAVKMIGGSLDPVQQRALENQVEKAAADRVRDRKIQGDAFNAWALGELEKNGGDYQALVKSNPAVAALPAEDRARLNDFAGKVATGVTRPTDWQAYNTLLDNPAVLKATNLDAVRDKFGAKELAQLKTWQKELNEPGAEQNLVSTHSLLKGMLEQAGYKRDEEREAKFFSLVQNAVDQELAVTGKKKLPQERVKEIAADLLVKDVTSKGILWDTKDTAFKIEVPPAERVRIEAALKAAGLEVNDYNILQAYRNKLKQRNAPAGGKTGVW
jgi:hypothetical protein